MNKIFNDLLPAIVFFAVYKMYDIFYATAALIVITIAQVVWECIAHRRVAKMQIFVAVLVAIFGGATLYFHDEEFIKWKVSIINWLFGFGLIIATYVMKETPMERMLKEAVQLESDKWKVINNMWGIYFIILGTINILIAYFFSTNVWMNFKLFGMFGITLLFLVLQSVYLSKHIKK